MKVRQWAVVLWGMISSICFVHGQDEVVRHWTEIRELSAAQINRQLPVYVDGTVVFTAHTRSFFVLGDGVAGIPVHVIGAFPDIETGDRLHIEGTTMRLLQQPGVRLVAWKKLEDQDAAPSVMTAPAEFDASDPYFQKVQVEGLVTSVARSDGELLIGFLRTTTEAHYLRIPDGVWQGMPPRRIIGHWIKAIGLFLPSENRISQYPGRSSFAISSLQDIHAMEDLVEGPVTTLRMLSEPSLSGPTQPVMMEGTLIQNDDAEWLLQTEEGLIALDWNGDTHFDRKPARCIGFPIKRIDRFALMPSLVLTQEEAPESDASPQWKLREPRFVDPIKSIADIHALEANQNLPVDVEVVVTYHHPPGFVFFVQDQTDGIYVMTANPEPEWLPAGTKLRLRGYAAKGFFQNNIIQAEYEVLGNSVLPPPEPCDFEELVAGQYDARYIEISGQVREVLRVENSLELMIESKTDVFNAIIRDVPLDKDPLDWLDCLVRLTGVSAFEWVDEKPVGILLYMQDASHLEVMRPRPYSELPPMQESVDLSELAETSNHDVSRILLHGYVTGKRASSTYTFQTKAQGFLIEPQLEDPNLSIGTFAQVLGWPRLGENGVLIERAVMTPIDANHDLVPIKKQVAPNLKRDHLYRLISRQGVLVEVNSDSNRINFVIRSSNERIAATLDVSDTPSLTSSSFKPGSLIRVQGVLQSIPNDDSLGEVPVLVLRDKKDIEVLAPPNWWNPRRILMALGITVVIGLSAVLWGMMLRRKVSQQTGHIRQMMIKERQAEEKYHNLFESALDLIFITDTQGKLVTVNQSCLAFFGKKLEEIQGEPLLQWIADADVAKVKHALGLSKDRPNSGIADGEVIEVAILDGDGRYRYVELSIRGLALQEGVFGYQAIARNVEARKQSERQLIRSRDSHREAHEAKTDFLTMISHDLRTPMNGVLGMTQLLLQSNLDEEQKEHVQTIYSASEGVLKLMLDMLDISRMETGRLTFVEETVDLVTMVEEVVATLRAEADLKRLDLVVICPPHLHCQVQTDAARLKQVLLNLVSNAIKFTDQGGVVLRLFEQERQSNHRLVRFEVQDSGVRFQGKERENLFEVLTKPDPDEPRRFGGNGLGLMLSKRIVHEMRGEIGADTPAGNGALFWFEIPFDMNVSKQKLPTLDMPFHKLNDSVLLVSDSPFVKEYFFERAKVTRFSIKTLPVDDFKLHLMSGSPWRGDSFQTLLLDCRHTPLNQLKSLLDQAHVDWINKVRWVLIDTGNQAAGSLSGLRLPAEPLRLVNPLSESSFTQLCQLLLKFDDGESAPVTRAAHLEKDQETSRLLKDAHLKVLVVEDDTINQKLLQIFLKKEGCIVNVVPEGGLALKELETQTYDVVLMDCNMAGMDGMETTRRIRSKEQFKDLTIIATTANVLKGFREKCFEAGMNDFLMKPLNLELLRKKLSRIAGQRDVE